MKKQVNHYGLHHSWKVAVSSITTSTNDGRPKEYAVSLPGQASLWSLTPVKQVIENTNNSAFDRYVSLLSDTVTVIHTLIATVTVTAVTYSDTQQTLTVTVVTYSA